MADLASVQSFTCISAGASHRGPVLPARQRPSVSASASSSRVRPRLHRHRRQLQVCAALPELSDAAAAAAPHVGDGFTALSHAIFPKWSTTGDAISDGSYVAAAAAPLDFSLLFAAKAPADGTAQTLASKAAGVLNVQERKDDWLSAVADPLEKYLFFLQDQLRKANVPAAQGISIMLLTLTVKLITFPFTRKQVESGISMQNLQPQIQALRERWPGDENAKRLNTELQMLYDKYQVNPLAGCFPTLITLPVFWGLYRALQNGASEGAFDDPFLWIPSLDGPVYETFPGNEGGLSWLWPLDANGLPPIGLERAELYLVLPVALVASQYISSVLLPVDTPSDDPKQKEQQETTKTILQILPLMVGFFSLSLPAGMGLYWLSNNIFTTSITYYLKYLGGAKSTVPKLDRPKLKLGTAVRTEGAEDGVGGGGAMASQAMAPGMVRLGKVQEALPGNGNGNGAAAAAAAAEGRGEGAAGADGLAPNVAAASSTPVPAMPNRSKRFRDPEKRKSLGQRGPPGSGGKNAMSA